MAPGQRQCTRFGGSGAAFLKVDEFAASAFRSASHVSQFVFAALDPAIHAEQHVGMDHRVISEPRVPA
jgi:hypothetical protein